MKLHDQVYMIVNKRTGAVMYTSPAKTRHLAWYNFLKDYGYSFHEDHIKYALAKKSYMKEGWRAIKIWIVSNIRYRGYEFQGTDIAKAFENSDWREKLKEIKNETSRIRRADRSRSRSRQSSTR